MDYIRGGWRRCSQILSNGLGKSLPSWLAQHEKHGFKRVFYGGVRNGEQRVFWYCLYPNVSVAVLQHCTWSQSLVHTPGFLPIKMQFWTVWICFLFLFAFSPPERKLLWWGEGSSDSLFGDILMFSQNKKADGIACEARWIVIFSLEIPIIESWRLHGREEIPDRSHMAVDTFHYLDFEVTF